MKSRDLFGGELASLHDGVRGVRHTAEIARDRRRSSLCHGGLPALRCRVYSCGHYKSDAPIWRVTTLSNYNPQHHRTATSAQFNSFYLIGFLPFR